MLTNPPIHYDFCVFLLSTYRGVNACLALCLKCERASRCFQPGEGPSMGLLRDCIINRLIVYSTSYKGHVTCSSLSVSMSGWLVRVLVTRTLVVCFFSSRPRASNSAWPNVVISINEPPIHFNTYSLIKTIPISKFTHHKYSKGH